MTIQNQPMPIWEILGAMGGIAIGGLCGPLVLMSHLGSIPASSLLGAFLLGVSGYGVPALVRTVRGR